MWFLHNGILQSSVKAGLNTKSVETFLSFRFIFHKRKFDPNLTQCKKIYTKYV